MVDLKSIGASRAGWNPAAHTKIRKCNVGYRNNIALKHFGVSFSTAYGRLKREILFDLVKKAGEDACFRCGKKIRHSGELSIDHKEAWGVSDDPKTLFFDINNISFSHTICNMTAGGNLFRKYNSRLEKDRAKRKRNHVSKMKYRKLWRQRRREAGLPYT